MRGLIAALALLAAAPSAAQTAPSAPAPIPEEMLAPNEQARALFEALPSNVMTDEMIETMFRSIPAEAARGMDAAVEQILAPGELVPGWRTSGIDLLPAIAAREGGLAGNMAKGRAALAAPGSISWTVRSSPLPGRNGCWSPGTGRLSPPTRSRLWSCRSRPS